MTQKNVVVVGGNVSESDVTKSGTAYRMDYPPCLDHGSISESRSR